jgi:hypothetical protein
MVKVDGRYVKRMEALLVVLEDRIDDAHFNIHTFLEASWRFGDDMPLTMCGTTGCLLGWYGYFYPESWLVKIDGNIREFVPSSDDACEYFGLVHKDGWDYLFDADYGPHTRQEAIERVRECIQAMKELSLKKFNKWMKKKGAWVRDEAEDAEDVSKEVDNHYEC